MIASISNRFAQFIRKHDQSAASAEVLVYGISVFLHSLLTAVLIIAVCTVSGRLLESLIAIFAFAILRFFSGGAHLHSSWKCDMFSTIAIVSIAHADFSSTSYVWVMNSIALVLAAMYAPNNPNLTYRLVEKHSGKLKWISMILITANFFMLSSVIASAFLLQSLTLTKPFYRIFNIIDRR